MTTDLAIQPVEQTATEAPVEVAATPEPSEAKPDENAEAQAPAENKEPTEADKVRHAMQKRIDRLTAKSSQLEQQYQEMLQKVQKYEQPKNDAPKEDDFETVEDYLKAVGKWEAKQETAKAEQESRQKEAEAKRLEIEGVQRQTFETRAAELRKTAPDFDDVAQSFVEELAELQPSEGTEALKTIIRSSPIGADITYHLGKNPDIVEGLKKTDTVGLARALFRIEYDLEKAPKKTVQAAPKPPAASKGTSSGVKDLNSMTPQELVKWASS